MSFEPKMDEIPKFYIKYLANEVMVSAKPLKGYVLHPESTVSLRSTTPRRMVDEGGK